MEPAAGCEKMTRGTNRTRLAPMNTNIARSQRLKLPLAVIAISVAAAIGTEMKGLTPK